MAQVFKFYDPARKLSENTYFICQDNRDLQSLIASLYKQYAESPEDEL